MYFSDQKYFSLIFRDIRQTRIIETIKTIQNQEVEVIIFILEIILIYNNVLIMVYLLNVCILHLRVDDECKKHMYFVQHYKVNIATSRSVGYIVVTKYMCDK